MLLPPARIKSRLSCFQLLESAPSHLQGLIFLAKTKAYLLASRTLLCVKTRSRHRRHAQILDQMLNESYVVAKAEGRDIRHHVICSTRHRTADSDAPQRLQHRVARAGV